MTKPILLVFLFVAFLISPSLVDAQSTVKIDIKANGSDGPVSLSGGPLNLTWTAPGTPISTTATDKVAGCSISGQGGVEPNDSSSIPILSLTDPLVFHPLFPTTTTTYVFTCFLVGPAPNYSLTTTSVSDSVTVNPPPPASINSFTGSHSTIDVASTQPFVLSWNVSNVTRIEYPNASGGKSILGACDISGIAYDRPLSGSHTMYLRSVGTANFTLVCSTGTSATLASRTVSVTVTQSANPPTTQVPCAPGDIYDYRDGSLCPGVTPPSNPPPPSGPPPPPPPSSPPTPCAPGDIYNYTNGTLCPGATNPNPPTTNPPPSTGSNNPSGGTLLPTPTPTTQQPGSFSSISVSKPGKQGVVLTANPTSLTLGQQAQLAWNSNGVSYCSSTDFYVPRTSSTTGSTNLYPLKTTTYWITCYTSTGTTRAWATIIVNGVPSTASPLSGSTSGGTAITTTNPTTTPVNNPNVAPFVDIKANTSDGSVTLAAGQSVVLSWTSANAGDCTLSSSQIPALTSGVPPTSTAVYPVGHPFFPKVNTTYAINCFKINPDSSLSSTPLSDSVTISPAITITPPPTLSCPFLTPPAASTKFKMGDRVQIFKRTLALSPNTTVATPITRPGPYLGGPFHITPPDMTLGTIVGGPVTSYGYTWWQVNYDNYGIGWSTEQLDIKPAVSGNWIKLNADYRADSEPGIGDGAYGLLKDAIGQIESGPVTGVGDSFNWWKVDYYRSWSDAWTKDGVFTKIPDPVATPPSNPLGVDLKLNGSDGPVVLNLSQKPTLNFTWTNNNLSQYPNTSCTLAELIPEIFPFGGFYTGPTLGDSSFTINSGYPWLYPTTADAMYVIACSSLADGGGQGQLPGQYVSDIVKVYSSASSAACGGSSNTTTGGPSSAGDAKFNINDRVQIVGMNVNVRGSASTMGIISGQTSTGNNGTVVGGPVTSGGYTWWQVNFDTAADGWVSEIYLVKI